MAFSSVNFKQQQKKIRIICDVKTRNRNKNVFLHGYKFFKQGEEKHDKLKRAGYVGEDLGPGKITYGTGCLISA